MSFLSRGDGRPALESLESVRTTKAQGSFSLLAAVTIPGAAGRALRHANAALTQLAPEEVGTPWEAGLTSPVTRSTRLLK